MTGRGLVLRVAASLVLCGALVFGITRWIAFPWAVIGSSMEPTLEGGDRVLVDLWSFRHRPPRRGDVVLIVGPNELPLVKRVDRGPLGRDERGWGPLLDPTRPWEEAYWVTGDNRLVSADSRTFGAVPRSRFRGRVFWRYWPPSRVGSIR